MIVFHGINLALMFSIWSGGVGVGTNSQMGKHSWLKRFSFSLLFSQGVGFTFEPAVACQLPGNTIHLVLNALHSQDSVQFWLSLLHWGVCPWISCPAVILFVCICFCVYIYLLRV